MNIWIKTILQQLLGTPGDTPATAKLSFTRKCIRRMQAWSLSEADITDVFRHGELVSENMQVRKYSGCEIGMYYVRDKRSGNYIVTAVRKRERR
jgi:hypothetical protein